jgi:DNA-directed RNA polymerase subunit F
MIKNSEPVCMVKALELMKHSGTENAELIAFVGKFSTLKPAETKKMGERLRELKIIKMNKEQEVKIIDLLPENSIDLNKIFVDINLDEDETKNILGVVKEFK